MFYTAELKIRGERRAGELLAAMEMKLGAKAIGPTAGPIKNTLKEIGLNKTQSSRWQQLAEMEMKPGVKAITPAMGAIKKTLKEIGVNKNQSSRWQFSNFLQVVPLSIVRSGYIHSPPSDLY